MAMQEMQVGDQVIRYDREATAAIYAGMTGGWAEGCGCVGCRNLVQQRGVIYPEPFRVLLQELGIDVHKESEAVANGPLGDGLCHYGGWFFFVGELLEAVVWAPRIVPPVPVRPGEPLHFKHFFTRFGPCPPEFRDVPKLAVEFEAHFHWVLKENFDSKLCFLPWPKVLRRST